MWNSDSSVRFVNVRIVDINDNPVTGRVLADWTVTFLRNGQSCLDVLNFENLGSGNYKVSYTPSGYGQDQLTIYDAATDLSFSDVEDVYGFAGGGGTSNTYTLDQNFGGANNLRITLAGPADYRLLLFTSEDWDASRRSEANALASSAVDAGGLWLNPMTVGAGTYHVVATKPQTVSVVFRYLKVGS